MSNIKKRAYKALNIKQYSKNNKPDFINVFKEIYCPFERQYTLRMIIKEPFDEFKIPEDYLWCEPLIKAAYEHQLNMGINQPFCYLTVRHGIVDTKKDDEWHVDGFSMNITHLPEQNYIWTNNVPTEYIKGRFNIPEDFNPLKHNIQWFFEDNINKNHKIKKCKPFGLYCLDPYVIHKRPKESFGELRTFVRISFTPIEIADLNNTLNPLIERKYTRDGLKNFRNKLLRYPNEK